MHRVGILLAACLAVSNASAAGTSERNDVPFPSQAFGAKFGMGVADFEAACKRAGGTATKDTQSGFSAVRRCSVALGAAPSLPTPAWMQAHFCGGAACMFSVTWYGKTAANVAEIEQTFLTKYGAATTRGLTHENLARRCADPANSNAPSLRDASWFFVDGTPKRNPVGHISIDASCGRSGIMVGALFIDEPALAALVAEQNF